MKLLQHEPERQTIIIVEGDHGNATVLEMLLAMGTSSIAFSYRSVTDLLSHINEVEQNHPALFLIDYFLPAINGLALCRYLHEIEEFKSIPVILVSASKDPSLLNEAQQLGITLLHKPYDVDTLLALVKQFTYQKTP